MLSRADVALYRAKSDGRGTYRFFTGPMDDEVRARVTAGRELREAIASNQFFLMYQPQVEIDSGRIVGLEALVRWHHPTRGVLQPGEFIREAERNGLILPLGHWVILEFLPSNQGMARLRYCFPVDRGERVRDSVQDGAEVRG